MVLALGVQGGLVSPRAACGVSDDELALVEPSWRPSRHLRPVVSRTPKAHPFQTNPILTGLPCGQDRLGVTSDIGHGENRVMEASRDST